MTDYNGNVREEKKKGNLMVHEIMELVAEIIERSSIDNIGDAAQFVRSVKLLEELTSGFTMMSMASEKRRKKITAEKLAKRLKIPIEMAKRTLRATTQLAVRTTDEASLTRKYRTNDRMLRYARLACDAFMDTTFASKGTSLWRG